MSKLMKRLVIALFVACGVSQLVADSSATVSGIGWSSIADGSFVDSDLTIGYAPIEGKTAQIQMDGELLGTFGSSGSFVLPHPTAGAHTLTHTVDGISLSASYTFGLALVSNVTVRQIRPWQGLVEIAYDLTADVKPREGRELQTVVVLQDGNGGKTYRTSNFTRKPTYEKGRHALIWDAAADDVTLQSTNVIFSVSIEEIWPSYCVVDLSSGADSESCPTAYLSSEPEDGFNTEEYKTTKLVLKRVDAGSFIMGYDQTDVSHRVTLTKPFYMGLFEVTQKQWELVMGSNPARYKGDMRPIENVSYNMIRGSSAGAQWPASNAVDADSFLGRLRARTGVAFDLPTEAQWEYACRAGTTTVYSYGDSAAGAYMWYNDNSDSQTHEVGAKLPNPWGFYDLHGNVWEWCLDWYGDLLFGVDPNGSSSGSSRVERGGSCYNYASICTSSYRYNSSPSSAYSSCGLRLVRILFD